MTYTPVLLERPASPEAADHVPRPSLTLPPPLFLLPRVVDCPFLPVLLPIFLRLRLCSLRMFDQILREQVRWDNLSTSPRISVTDSIRLAASRKAASIQPPIPLSSAVSMSQWRTPRSCSRERQPTLVERLLVLVKERGSERIAPPALRALPLWHPLHRGRLTVYGGRRREREVVPKHLCREGDTLRRPSVFSSSLRSHLPGPSPRGDTRIKAVSPF